MGLSCFELFSIYYKKGNIFRANKIIPLLKILNLIKKKLILKLPFLW
jgi:hypothetical protein